MGEWTLRAENELNHYYTKVDKVLVLGLPDGVDAAALTEKCEAFGGVANVHLPEGRNFAFVTFKEEATAAAAIKVGMEFDDQSGAAVKPRVQPAKLLCKDVMTWRTDLRAKWAEVAKARDALPCADPTEQCNTGNNFRVLYGDMVVERKD